VLFLQDFRIKLEHRQANILDHQTAIKSAVMLPLIIHKGQPSLLFEVRSQDLKGQPGEICFPGGHIEPGDASPQEAALRETCEELGIKKEALGVWGPLDVLVTPFQLILYPFVCEIKAGTQIIPNSEVDHVFYVPLNFLLKTKPLIHQMEVKVIPEENFPFQLIQNGKDYNWRTGHYPVYFYLYENYIIWGLTARILAHFLEVIR
jgi:8-oxo-dGTP pyrophosphatase MutT (NUDIX family)